MQDPKTQLTLDPAVAQFLATMRERLGNAPEPTHKAPATPEEEEMRLAGVHSRSREHLVDCMGPGLVPLARFARERRRDDDDRGRATQALDELSKRA